MATTIDAAASLVAVGIPTTAALARYVFVDDDTTHHLILSGDLLLWATAPPVIVFLTLVLYRTVSARTIGALATGIRQLPGPVTLTHELDGPAGNIERGLAGESTRSPRERPYHAQRGREPHRRAPLSPPVTLPGRSRIRPRWVHHRMSGPHTLASADWQPVATVGPVTVMERTRRLQAERRRHLGYARAVSWTGLLTVALSPAAALGLLFDFPTSTTDNLIGTFWMLVGGLSAWRGARWYVTAFHDRRPPDHP